MTELGGCLSFTGMSGTNVMLNFLFGSIGFCTGSGGEGFGSSTGKRGRNVKLVVRLGDDVGVVVGESRCGDERVGVGCAEMGGGDTGRCLGVGGDVDGNGVTSEGSAEVGVSLSGGSEASRRGSSLIGTASR